MIVVDTSVWIDFIRAGGRASIEPFAELSEQLLLHDFVVGELALGNFRDRRSAFRKLAGVFPAPTASTRIVRELIETQRLHSTGIGYVDVHLLASTLLVEGGRLWTRDKRLGVVAGRLGIRAEIE
ncbi:type II toxin-antitoxin system VapC family toxin [Aureimonas leprariae]|uniref:Type II toxin-antitoxin system VapC family toxin n=1 Tax=Plantimonas leprariae TaxID=2615207 RepID=A0A7V7PLJ2_9HYPH|nr:type II toxin-antitoxin system VapC family toxin [Aureimonas leprariae]KAB0677081.1 type II toxin-antitoxin system VapC family toxin [Aureimonas leprariae]